MLFKKMLRDLKDNKGSFISVFLLTFLAAFLAMGMSGEATGLQEVIDGYYSDTNLADYWVYGENFNNDDIKDVRAIDGVDDADGQFVFKAIGDMKDDPTVMMHFIKDGDISKFYLLEGDEFNTSDEDGIWLDKRFADARNLSVGDKIKVEFEGVTIEKTIRGLGYSPEYVYFQSETLEPDFYKYGYGYLSSEALPEIIPYDYNAILIDSDLEKGDLEAELNDTLGKDDYSSLIAQKDQFGVKTFQAELDQHRMFSGIFVALFLVISIMVLLTAMTRIINHQRTQIGVLKALGFSNNRILLHYTSYGFYMPFLGAVLGIIIGPATIPYFMFPFFETSYTIPAWKGGFSIEYMIICLLMVAASVVISFIATRKVANESPADTLTQKTPKTSSLKFIENIKIFQFLPFSSKWNLRDFNRNKLRTIVSIIGVIGCVILLFQAFAMSDSINDMITWEYGDINSYENKLTLNDTISLSQADHIAKEVNGTQLYEGSIELRANGITKSGSISVHNETELLRFTDNAMNHIDIGQDEIAISGQMAELLGVEVGDTVEWHLTNNNEWESSKIDAIYYDPLIQGMYMSPENFEDHGDLNFTPNSIVTDENVDENYTDVAAKTSVRDLLDSFEIFMEIIDIMIVLFVAFAVALAFVVLYNLGIMTYTETERELATLRVLGFKNNYLRRILVVPNIFYAVIGFILGLPVSYYVFQVVMASIGEDYYYPRVIHPQTLLIIFVLVLVVNIVIGLFVSRKLKKLDMVESLKAKE